MFWYCTLMSPKADFKLIVLWIFWIDEIIWNWLKVCCHHSSAGIGQSLLFEVQHWPRSPRSIKVPFGTLWWKEVWSQLASGISDNSHRKNELRLFLHPLLFLWKISKMQMCRRRDIKGCIAESVQDKINYEVSYLPRMRFNLVTNDHSLFFTN